jgi:hypothetical protein
MRLKLRHLFTVNIFFAIFYGGTCSFVPCWLLRLYGLSPDDAAIWTTRLVGGSILGFATLMWFGRGSASVDTRKAIALALLIQDVIGCIASLEFQLSGKVNVFGWFSFALYGLLAIAYAFFLFAKRENC